MFMGSYMRMPRTLAMPCQLFPLIEDLSTPVIQSRDYNMNQYVPELNFETTDQ